DVFGRLVNEHVEPGDAVCARGSGLLEKDGLERVVDEVVDESTGRDKSGGRGRLSDFGRVRHADGRAVDDQVGRAAGSFELWVSEPKRPDLAGRGLRQR